MHSQPSPSSSPHSLAPPPPFPSPNATPHKLSRVHHPTSRILLHSLPSSPTLFSSTLDPHAAAAVILPPPLSILAPLPRHLRLHASLQEQLQGEARGGEREGSVSPPPLFSLHTASTSPSRTPSPSSSPSLADHFPPLPDAEAEPPSRPVPAFASFPPSLQPPSPDSPPFHFTHHLSPHSRAPSFPPFPLSCLSPDPKAFAEQRSLLKKTPKAAHKPCPPTPMRLKRPANLQRASSLYETKVLVDDLPTPVPPHDAPEHRTPTGEGAWAQVPHAGSPSSQARGGVGGGEKVTFEGHFAQPQLVGEGSFFQVFKAQWVATGETFAVKRSLRTFRGKKDREGYVRECELIRRLGYHPHILRLVRAWQEELHLFIQMEYLPYTLQQWGEACEARGHKTAATLCGWLYQLCLALRHLHSHGLLHLDIKPDNVLVTERGLIKLGDFGSARGVAEVGDGSEGDCRYAALELLHVQQREAGQPTPTPTPNLSAENIFVHPPGEGAAGEGSPASLALITAPVSCPTTPAAFNAAIICPATSTSTSSVSTPSTASSQASVGGASCAVSFGTDMFSLGLLMLEVASDMELPKDGLVWHELREGRAEGHVVGKVGGEVMERLIVDCLNPRVEERPSAAALIERLKPLVDREALLDIGVHVE